MTNQWRFSAPKTKAILTYYRNYTLISGFVGAIDEEFLEGISLVWLVAAPPTPRAHHIMGVLYIFMMSIGFVGNAFVLFMFLKYVVFVSFSYSSTYPTGQLHHPH